MTVQPTFAFRSERTADPVVIPDPEPPAVMAAVREDIRQTLRTAWIDPAIEAASADPRFFTAAWSAVRPNVGRSFLVLARATRGEAMDGARGVLGLPDLRGRLRSHLSDEEVRRLEEAAKASLLAAPKAQIVMHVFHRAVRRDRIAGTGREEPPIRRGVPDWQRWMSIHSVPEESAALLDEVARDLGLVSPPASLRLLGRWPAALAAVSETLGSAFRDERWATLAARVRRAVLGGVNGLPHPVDLQWTVLKTRGFTEEDRTRAAEEIARHEQGMPVQTLVAASVWAVLGGPDPGVES